MIFQAVINDLYNLNTMINKGNQHYAYNGYKPNEMGVLYLSKTSAVQFTTIFEGLIKRKRYSVIVVDSAPFNLIASHLFTSTVLRRLNY